MKLRDRLRAKITDEFAARIDKQFEAEFGVRAETTFDFLGCMRMVTVRTDKKKLTQEQRAWLEGFSSGYDEARNALAAPEKGGGA